MTIVCPATLVFLASCSGETPKAPCTGDDCGPSQSSPIADDAGARPHPSDASPGQKSEDACAKAGVFPNAWISGGPACANEPQIQVHQYNEDTFILRQSLCTSPEAPFLYLLFGDDKAILEDTGDGSIDLVGTVNTIVKAREVSVGHTIELIVVNSHAHGDHVQGNQAFGADGATLVGANKDAVSAYFGMGWPREIGSIDLGNRIVDIAGIPGHQADHIAMYDRKYRLLFTGDTLYPGRLYINDFQEYKQSISFLHTFAETREVCAILGTHIEMTTTPGVDFVFGLTHHPNERELLLTRDHLQELNTAIQAMNNTPIRQVHNDFIIVP